jgi:hypothetical protein
VSRTKLKNDEYQCAICGEIYVKGLSDEEAMAEKMQLIPDIPLDECALICDDCFIVVKKWEKRNGFN